MILSQTDDNPTLFKCQSPPKESYKGKLRIQDKVLVAAADVADLCACNRQYFVCWGVNTNNRKGFKKLHCD